MSKERPAVEWFLAFATLSIGVSQINAALQEKGGNVMLRLAIVDGATNQPLPSRVHLYDADGKPQQAGDLPFFQDHFSCPGTADLWLPAGTYTYEIERGPEYESKRGHVTATNGERPSLEVILNRVTDLPAKGWYPGDLHVHRPVESIELLMRAEDLYVAPVITWWNKKNLWSDQPPPHQPLVRFDGSRFYQVMAGEDERNGGAFMYFNRTQPLDITAGEKEWPSPVAYLEKAGKGVWIDIEKPFWLDVPAALACGFGDSIGLANNHMCRSSMYESEAWGKARDTQRLPPPRGNGFWSQEIYYDILNCGFRIPPSAGSASGVLPNPLGYDRVYVQVSGALTWERWWEGLRAGRCFVTNGPLLLVRANGELPGHVFRSSGPRDLELTAEITSRDPVPAIEVVQNGRVVLSVPYEEWKSTGRLGSLRFEESGWFLVRAITGRSDTFRFASTGPFYVEVGGQARRISRGSTQFFLDWARDRANSIHLDDPGELAEVMRYQQKSVAFWEGLVKQANAE